MGSQAPVTPPKKVIRREVKSPAVPPPAPKSDFTLRIPRGLTIKLPLMILPLLLLCAAAAPAPLAITKGGTYTGTYSTITVNTTQPVTIDRCTLTGPGDCIACDQPCALTVTNCTFSTKSPGKAIVVWRFTTLDIEHNTLNGTGGILVRDFANTAKSATISFNKANNITGATSATTDEKTSFIQFQDVHCHIDIGWDHLQNQRGIGDTEDGISLGNSGGTSADPALIHDNFVDGIFAYPLGTTCTGSGIMCFDPMGDFNVTVGGYAKVYSNQVIASENQAIVAAGGHDIEVFGNRAVNDGTTTKVVSFGYQVFNWANKTPANVFGKNVSFHDNFAYYTSNGHPINWSFVPGATGANNDTGPATDAGERQRWAAKCAAAKVCVGPLPAATTQP